VDIEASGTDVRDLTQEVHNGERDGRAREGRTEDGVSDPESVVVAEPTAPKKTWENMPGGRGNDTREWKWVILDYALNLSAKKMKPELEEISLKINTELSKSEDTLEWGVIQEDWLAEATGQPNKTKVARVWVVSVRGIKRRLKSAPTRHTGKANDPLKPTERN
jgi:hypothetical protein